MTTSYKLYMISFERIGSMPKAFNVIKGDGANCEAWHLDMLEEYCREQRQRLAYADVL